MIVLLQVLLLAAGFLLLTKGADFFVDGCAGIAEKLGVSQLVIGLTIVAMGTSAPELAVSVNAAFHKSSDISIGNVVGSNILNILIILGITAVLTTVPIQESTVKFEMPFLIFITAVLIVIGGFGNDLSQLDGVILLALFVCYWIYLFRMAKKNPPPDQEIPDDKAKNIWLLLFFTVIGIIMVLAGAEFTVDAAKKLARMAGLSERFISVTIVALGTSLPELVTSVTAALKKNADLAIGNIVGSNVFNILFILGLTAVITPIHYSEAFFIDNIVAIFATMVLWACSLSGRNLNRRNGVLFLAIYGVYFVFLLQRSSII